MVDDVRPPPGVQHNGRQHALHVLVAAGGCRAASGGEAVLQVVEGKPAALEQEPGEEEVSLLTGHMREDVAATNQGPLLLSLLKVLPALATPCCTGLITPCKLSFPPRAPLGVVLQREAGCLLLQSGALETVRI